jgi:hypothetical protein
MPDVLNFLKKYLGLQGYAVKNAPGGFVRLEHDGPIDGCPCTVCRWGRMLKALDEGPAAALDQAIERYEERWGRPRRLTPPLAASSMPPKQG